MKGLCLSVFLGFFLLQGSVLAASDEFTQLTTVMQQAGFTGDDIARVHSSLNEAVRQGVPSGPLLGKMNEGIVKGASAEQIVRAMTMVGERYTRAGQYLQELELTKTGGAGVLPLLVNAQAAGMAVEDLNTVISRLRDATGTNNDSPERDRVIRETLIFTQELRRMGVHSKLVADLVSSMLGKGAEGADFIGMTADLRKMSDRRMIGEQARLWLETVENGVNIAEVRKALQTRFNSRAEQATKSGQETGAGQGNQQGQDNGSGQHNGGQNNGSGSGADNGANGGGGASSGGQGQQGN